MNLTNLYNILLFFGVSQGVFLSIAIPFSKNANNPANKVLTIIVACATLMLSGRILYYLVNGEWVIRLAGLVDTTIFLFGPLIYLYVQKFTGTQTRFSRLHYLPALLHLIYFGITFSFSLAQLGQFYTNGHLGPILFSIEGSGIISLSTYLFLSFSQLKKVSSLDTFGSKSTLPVKKYLFYFISIFSILAVIWMISFLLTITNSSLSLISYATFWIITPFIFYIVGYFSLSSPEILRDFLKRSNPARLSSTEIGKLKARLKFLMEEEKVYLNPELTLKDLAEQLETSPNNLSWYLNKVHQKSFYDFMNQIRIDAFQTRINGKEHQKHTLLAIALDVGFNSKSTFNRAFKSLLGNTPSNWVKNHTSS